jgi:putative acetyltransferase
MSLMPDGHLDMAFVLPEVMGKGHAAALYEALLAHAQAAGMARLTVHASEYSRRFLARRGWVLDRVEVLNRDSGVRFDRSHMSLVLPGGPQ